MVVYKKTKKVNMRRVKKNILIYNTVMFSFLKKKPQDEQVHLVCLVTSYAVTAAVVKVFTRQESVQEPVLLFSCESIIPIRDGFDYRANASLTYDAIKYALNKCRAFNPVYDKLYCSIGEPWTTSMTRTAHLEKREAFSLTQKVIDDLVTRESKLFEQEVARMYAGSEEVGLLQVSKPLIDANGYRIANPMNALVASVDVHSTFSLVSLSFIDGVVGVFVDVFHRTDIQFTSFDLAKSALLNDYDHGTVVEMGGDTISIVIKQGGVPTLFAAIPEGLHRFEIALMQLFDVPQKKIPQVLSFVGDENIIEHERERYYHRIVRAYEEISPAIALRAIDIKKHVQQLPEPVVVIGHPEWVDVLKVPLEKDLGSRVIIPRHDLFRDQVIISHQAHVITNSLLLAVMHAIRYEK